MKVLVTALFVVLVAFTGRSQGVDTIDWTPNAAGAFLQTSPQAPAGPFAFRGQLLVENRRERIGPTNHAHLVVHAQWLRTDPVPDSLEKRYEALVQLYFDCYELESRKLQEAINLPYASLPEEIELSEQRAQAQVTSIRSFTSDGRDQKQLRHWRRWMDSSLVATPRLFQPVWEFSPFELGLDIGPAFTAFNGKLADYFGPQPGWGIGGGFRYGRLACDYHILYAYTRSQLAFSKPDFSFADSNRLRLNQSTWSVGVRLFGRQHFSLIPYAAVSTFRILNRDKNKGSIDFKGPASVTIEGGFIAEWRFHAFYQNNLAQFAWNVQLKAGYAPIHYVGAISGSAVRIQLGIGWNLHAVVNGKRYGD